MSLFCGRIGGCYKVTTFGQSAFGKYFVVSSHFAIMKSVSTMVSLHGMCHLLVQWFHHAIVTSISTIASKVCVWYHGFVSPCFRFVSSCQSIVSSSHRFNCAIMLSLLPMHWHYLPITLMPLLHQLIISCHFCFCHLTTCSYHETNRALLFKCVIYTSGKTYI